MSYNSVSETNNLNSYTGDSIMTFYVSGAQMTALKANSLYLCGMYQTSDLVRANYAGKNYEGKTGLHGIIDNLTVESALGILDNIQYYNRLVSTYSKMSKYKDSSCVSRDASYTTMYNYNTPFYLRGDNQHSAAAGANAASGLLPFAIQLFCCLNNASGDISFEKHQYFKITIRLKPYFIFSSTSTLYTVTQPTINFRTTLDKPENKKTIMIAHVGIPQDFSSSNAYYSIVGTGVTTDLFCNFLTNTKLNNTAFNQNDFDRPLGFNLLSVKINGSSTLTSYEIVEEDEAIENGKRAVENSSYSDAWDWDGLQGVTTNAQYVLGMHFPQPLQLNGQTMNLQMGFDGNTTKYNCFIYYKKLIE